MLNVFGSGMISNKRKVTYCSPLATSKWTVTPFTTDLRTMLKNTNSKRLIIGKHKSLTKNKLRNDKESPRKVTLLHNSSLKKNDEKEIKNNKTSGLKENHIATDGDNICIKLKGSKKQNMETEKQEVKYDIKEEKIEEQTNNKDINDLNTNLTDNRRPLSSSNTKIYYQFDTVRSNLFKVKRKKTVQECSGIKRSAFENISQQTNAEATGSQAVTPYKPKYSTPIRSLFNSNNGSPYITPNRSSHSNLDIMMQNQETPSTNFSSPHDSTRNSSIVGDTMFNTPSSQGTPTGMYLNYTPKLYNRSPDFTNLNNWNNRAVRSEEQVRNEIIDRIQIRQRAHSEKKARAIKSLNFSLGGSGIHTKALWNKKKICPKYRNFQLMGDSQFVRFARQVLGYETMNYRKINYCVSGQTIEDLYTMLVREEHAIHDHILLMIGTNDMLRRVNIKDMMFRYNKLIQFLLPRSKKILLVTLPPIPLLEIRTDHWHRLNLFNTFIKLKSDGEKVFYINLSEEMLIGKNSSNVEYYEKTYGSSPRRDLIHLNTKGFEVLKKLLDENYDTWIPPQQTENF